MHLPLLATTALLVRQAYSISTLAPRLNFFEDLLLFDGLAFQDASDKSLLAELQSFTFFREVRASPVCKESLDDLS
jgi:hypothetical protein